MFQHLIDYVPYVLILLNAIVYILGIKNIDNLIDIDSSKRGASTIFKRKLGVEEFEKVDQISEGKFANKNKTAYLEKKDSKILVVSTVANGSNFLTPKDYWPERDAGVSAFIYVDLEDKMPMVRFQVPRFSFIQLGLLIITVGYFMGTPFWMKEFSWDFFLSSVLFMSVVIIPMYIFLLFTRLITVDGLYKHQTGYVYKKIEGKLDW